VKGVLCLYIDALMAHHLVGDISNPNPNPAAQQRRGRLMVR
jgi:hypothetical protein